jgi:hypothetical protein
MRIVMILMLVALSIATCAANDHMLSPFYPTVHKTPIWITTPVLHSHSIYSVYYNSVYYDSGLTEWNDIYYRSHYAPVYTYYYDWTGVRRPAMWGWMH